MGGPTKLFLFIGAQNLGLAFSVSRSKFYIAACLYEQSGLPLRTMARVCFTWARHMLRTLPHYLDCVRDIVFFKDDVWQVANPQDATGN